MMTPERIAKIGACSVEIATKLLAGIDRDDLLGLVSGDTPEARQIDQMNLVARLRALGYVVQGGRCHLLRDRPKTFFQIIDYRRRVYAPGATSWDGERRELLQWVHQLPELNGETQGLMSTIDDSLRRFTRPLHEGSWGYLLCYEGSRLLKGGRARSSHLFVSPEGTAVLTQRDTIYPRFTIVVLDLVPERVDWLAKQLATISFRPVRAINADPVAMKRLDPAGHGETRKQFVYRLEDLAVGATLSSRARTYVRRHERTTTFSAGCPSEVKLLIDRWREVNEPRRRQLSSSRDYVAIDYLHHDAERFYATRADGTPCACHILSVLPAFPTYVAQIVEKSLNYPTIPGGEAGTSYYNYVMTARALLDRGYTHINGGCDGGEGGLGSFKRSISKVEDDLKLFEWYASYPTERSWRHAESS